MTTYASQMVGPLLKGQHSPTVVGSLGTDVMSVGKEPYNLNLTTLCLIAMVMKAVQDLNPLIASDAWWQNRLDHALDTGPNFDTSGWPGWIVLQVAPEQLARYGATDTDSVAQLQAKIDAYNANLAVQATGQTKK